MTDEDEMVTEVLIDEDGGLIIHTHTPWCDCASRGRKVGFGYTKRADGVWVRPCCMRPEKARWEKWGDKPTPPIGSKEYTDRLKGLKELEQDRSQCEQEKGISE